MTVRSFPPNCSNYPFHGQESQEKSISTLEEMEMQMIRKALDTCAGNLSAVAAQLGITRQTLYNKMKKFRIMTVQLQQVGVQYWFRVLADGTFCISSVWFGIHQSYSWLGVSLCLLVLSVLWQIRLYRLHTKQVLFMIDALENNDNTFHFTEENGTPESKEINRALNRVGHIL